MDKSRNIGLRLIPLLMIVAAICFGIRFSEMLGGGVMSSLSSRSQETATESLVLAQLEPSAGQGAAPPEESPEEAAAKSLPEPAAKPVIDAPSLGEPPQKSEWKGADDLDDEYSEVKMELFEDLSQRRKDLDRKEKDLEMREALLKATQAELEQKYQELVTIKGEIEELLKKQSEEEDKRIASLVKIYEGMKAKDAARIFDTLDMDVLLQVMTRMSERKSAPILAAMDADKARNVTIMLAEQNKLPSLPELGGGLTNP